jgi:hypothetical protein
MRVLIVKKINWLNKRRSTLGPLASAAESAGPLLLTVLFCYGESGGESRGRDRNESRGKIRSESRVQGREKSIVEVGSRDMLKSRGTKEIE